MKNLLTLVHEYATARASAARSRALAEHTTGDAHDAYTPEAAEWDATAAVRLGKLHTALDLLTRTTERAVPDDRLPVCTGRKGTVEARAVLPDRSRGVRVQYTPAQTIAAGAALIACAALADGHTGGTLTPILPAFPATVFDSAATGLTHGDSMELNNTAYVRQPRDATEYRLATITDITYSTPHTTHIRRVRLQFPTGDERTYTPNEIVMCSHIGDHDRLAAAFTDTCRVLRDACRIAHGYDECSNTELIGVLLAILGTVATCFSVSLDSAILDSPDDTEQVTS